MADQAIYRVFIRGNGYQRIGELTAWSSLELVLRFNDVGTWALETASDSLEAALLTKTGGIIVTREIDGHAETIFSGFVWTEWGWTATTFRASGYSDDALLWQPCRPSPGLASPPWPDDYYVRTGVASVIMRGMVNEQMGPAAVLPWRNSDMVFTPEPYLGSVITVRGNLQPVLTLLAELAITPYAGGLGFSLRQSDTVANKIEFDVYAPPDKSADAKFSIDLGTAADYEDIAEAPEANQVYVLGGDGFGANRTVIEAVDLDSIAEWGKRIVTVIDMRGTADIGELNVRAAEAIAGVSTLRRVAVTPFDVPSLQYGVDYDLGTLVTIVTAGGETVDLIRQVQLTLDPERGAVVVPIVGQGDGSDEERSQTITRTIQNRISNLERNWNVPPDSVDRAMMVPVMKPPIGAVAWLAGPSVPSGYLACQGQAVSRTGYSLLFAAIGTTWGSGNGSTTFNLPNLANRSPIGSGAAYSLGQLLGATTADLGAHAHSGAAHTHPGSHSHGTVSHSHSGAAHTHPGTHAHDLDDHRHQMGHDHTIDFPPFQSGKANIDSVAVGHASLGSGATDHHHSVDVPAGTTNTSAATVTGSGETTVGAFVFLRTGNDSDTGTFGASYSGASGGATPGTESDSNAFAASYSGTSGAAGSSTVSIVQPSAGLFAVIYAGV